MKWQTVAEENGTLTFSPTYNLFRRKWPPDLGCAVPEDRPVPAFLDGSSWEYAGTLRQDDAPPPGFDPAAAECGARWNGFHLFQTVRPGPVQAPACRLRERIDRNH
ncbi:hypothetical protein [Microvirga sp. M2]|uniref:hypothetical protein n=1 Tax=Microvirga sp. M2 TaxID=3073270 RepID=UPI0039C49516